MEELALHLDYRQKVPFAEQIENQLRLLIQQGQLRPNDQLPAVRQLAFQLKINFNTVARAYRVLDMEGWITTQQGRGTYVLEQAPVVETTIEEASFESELAQAQETSAVSPEGADQAARPDQIQSQSTDDKEPPAEAENASTEDPQSATAAQSEWITHWLAQAEQMGISMEQLHQAINARRDQTQARLEPAARPASQPSITRKRNLKPLHQKTGRSERWGLQETTETDRPFYKRKPRKKNKHP